MKAYMSPNGGIAILVRVGLFARKILLRLEN